MSEQPRSNSGLSARRPYLLPALTFSLFVSFFLGACGGTPPVLPEPAADLMQWEIPSPQPDRIVLTWAGDPTRTQSVSWRTDTTVAVALAEVALATPHPGFVDAAETFEASTETVDASVGDGTPVVANFHSVTFSGLTPDTLYAYRLGDGDHWSEWHQFRTASPDPEPFSFLYFGDAQNDILSLWTRTVRSSVLKEPEARFMIHSGDLVNRAHRNAEWGEWTRAGGFLMAMVPSIPAAGNHEYRRVRMVEEEAVDEAQLSIYWQPQFTLPDNGPEGVDGETVYYIDFQGVRVVTLNSARDVEAQTAWLDEVLAENDQTWTIVTHHHPVFSSAGDRDNEELREAWKPIYDRHGVDLVLQGHDHTYGRGRTHATAENLPSGTNLRDDETGTVYVVSVSGRKMYDIKDGLWDRYEATMDRHAENTQLFQVIRVDGNRLTFEAYTPTGELYDIFELEKQDGRPNRFVEGASGFRTYRFRDTDKYIW